MTTLPRLLLPLLALGLLFPCASDAWARGGRYAAPRGPSAAPSTEDPTPPPAADAACADEATPHAAPPTLAAPNATIDTSGGLPRGRRAAVSAVGMADWLHWYEVNRERFEDHRALFRLTESNPVFAVGDAGGPAVGAPSIRVGDRTRAEILSALEKVFDNEGDHWLHTEAAAYVALGKVAVGEPQIARHLQALAQPKAESAYLQESAALGLGNLHRTDTARQLPAALLDRVRDDLLRVLQDDRYGYRTRAFAATSLGVLADQPTRHADAGPTFTATRLFDTWIQGDLPDEVAVGVLLGLSRVPADDVPRVIKLVLEGGVAKGRTQNGSVSALVRSHLVLALGHLGDASSAKAIATVLEARKVGNPAVSQGAVLAATVLGRRHEEARHTLGKAMLKAARSSSDAATQHLAWVGLGRILAEEVGRTDTYLLEELGAGRLLLEEARSAPPSARAFARFACALATRPIDAAVDNAAWQMFRYDTLEMLRKALDERKWGTHAQAATCVSLGLAMDRTSGRALLDILRDEDRDPDLRAYAALGLGLMGDARTGVTQALVKGLGDTRSEVLRMRSATALGLLAGGGFEDHDRVVKTLLDAMRTTRSQVFKGQVAITLGRLGDARAVKILADILGGERESHLNRAVACAALGLVGDEALSPAMQAVREDAHYLAGSAVVREILDLL